MISELHSVVAHSSLITLLPELVYGKSISPQNLGERATFADIAATLADLFGLPP